MPGRLGSHCQVLGLEVVGVQTLSSGVWLSPANLPLPPGRVAVGVRWPSLGLILKQETSVLAGCLFGGITKRLQP